MQRVAMIGTQLIHTYPYAVYFNGCDVGLFKANAKPWMAAMYGDESPPQVSQNLRLTHVWGGDPAEARKLAEACHIDTIAANFDDMVDAVDAVMVMDENIYERARLARPYVEAGKAVYIDKIISLEPVETANMLEVAAAKGGRVAAWSQLRFAPGFEPVRQMSRGGVAAATFRLNLDMLPAYAIHLISAVQGVFGHGATPQVIYGRSRGPQILLGYPDGTSVLLRISPEAPAQWNIYYAAREGTWAGGAGSSRVMFDRSAAAIEAMVVDGRETVTPDDMVESTKLVQLMCVH